MLLSQIKIILVLLILCGLKSASAIPATLYCTTLNPTGLIILDLSTAKEIRLTTGHVDHIAKGMDGYIAVTHDDSIEIFHHAVGFPTIKRIRPVLIGWVNLNLVFRSNNRVYTLDIATGKIRAFFLQSHIRSVCAVKKNVLVVEEHDAFTLFSLFDPDHKIIHQWKNMDGTPASDPLVKDNRWIVLEMYKEGELTHLCIIDTQLKTQSYLIVNNWGLSAGHTSKEIIICRPKQKTVSTKGETTEVISLNLETLKIHSITSILGVHNLVGLSNDNKWLLTQIFPTEVGPGILYATRLSDKKTRMLRHEVYEAFLF